jgi:hypothetical protein
MSKKLAYSEKRFFKNKEKRLEKKHYAILIGLMLAFIFLSTIDNTLIIGEDFRFPLFTLFLPLIIGIVILIFYRKEFLIAKFSNEKNNWIKSFMVTFYLTEALLVAFLALAYPTQFILTQINRKVSSSNSTEIIKCEVAKFFDKRRSTTIDFKYENNWEQIRISHDEMKPYINEDPKKYILELTVKKGMWNTYIVQTWELHIKQKTSANFAKNLCELCG